jgi:hypothetical protein
MKRRMTPRTVRMGVLGLLAFGASAGRLCVGAENGVRAPAGRF